MKGKAAGGGEAFFNFFIVYFGTVYHILYWSETLRVEILSCPSRRPILKYLQVVQ